jgi:hypothetical protein
MCTMPVDPGCSSEWAVMWMEDTDDGGVFSRPKEIGGVCGSAGRSASLDPSGTRRKVAG